MGFETIDGRAGRLFAAALTLVAGTSLWNAPSLAAGPAAAKSAPAKPVAGKPAAPPAPFQWKEFVTQGWKAMLPNTWTADKKAKSKESQDRGLWIYGSPNRNLKLRIRIRRDRGEDFAKAAEENLKRLLARGPGSEVLQEKVSADSFVALVKTPMRRKTNKHEFYVFRFMSKDAERNLRVTISLAGTAARLDRFLEVAHKVADSFDVISKAQPAPTKAGAARPPAGKPAHTTPAHPKKG